MRLEFTALRAEILATQQRNFQTIGFGVLGLPAVNYVLHEHDIQAVSLAMPLLVIVIAFLYLADNQGILRCGRYIRKCIEPRVEGQLGWENWLEHFEPAINRTTERYMVWAIRLLFFLYYVAATWLAWNYCFLTMPIAWAMIILVAYTSVGACVSLHVYRNLEVSSRRPKEPLSERDAERLHRYD